MSQNKFGLGRGLDALIARKAPQPSSTPAQSPSQVVSPPSIPKLSSEEPVVEVPITLIFTGSNQPRKEFNQDQLRELAISIREYGIIQPLVVCKDGGRYRLIAGERRLRAAKMNNLTVVPIVVRDDNEHRRLAVAMIENVQRVDLNPIETALGYQRLCDDFNMKHEELARHLGKSRPVISNTIRLLNLHPELQDAVRSGFLTYGQGRALCAIRDHADQLHALREIQERGIKKEEIENLAKDYTKRTYIPRMNMDPTLRDKEIILRDYFGTRVNILKRKKGGILQIEYYSDEDLKSVIGKIIFE